MATDVMEGRILSTEDDFLASSNYECALLLVIGEPVSEEHKTLILEEVARGLRCWDNESDTDLNNELIQIANKAALGDEGPEGERIIQQRSEKLAVEILVNPQSLTVMKSLKTLLTTEASVRYLLYAGHVLQGSAAWLLQDDAFTVSRFLHVLKDSDVENALKQQEGGSFIFHSLEGNEWENSISKQFSKYLHVKVNPPEALHSSHGILQFTAYVGSFLKIKLLSNMLQSSDVVGNIRFTRPTLYIFPGCQGDSALFGISGFNLLVNGGYSRKACFWDLTRHLDRIDAILLTHLGTDNLFGISSVLQRKSLENVHPEIGFIYLNTSEKMKQSPSTSEEIINQKEPTLMMSLAEEGNHIIELARKVGQAPHQCSRALSGQNLDPVNLYHKVGHGSLDMYVLNPVQDSKELKEFYQQWNKQVSQFGSQHQVPLPNMLSICALLVWRPASPQEKITRIFFPGNAPQYKIIEGLEKIKHLDFLKHAFCSEKDLLKATLKKSSVGGSKAASKSPLKSSAPLKAEASRKADVKAERPKSSTPRGNKIAKEDTNKKALKIKEKEKDKEKEDKSKSSTSSSPSKSSFSAGTPAKTTPDDTPKELTPCELDASDTATSAVSLVDIPMPPSVQSVQNHIVEPSESPSDLISIDENKKSSGLSSHEFPEPLPDPVQVEAESKDDKSSFPFMVEKNKLEELGIYEDDMEAEDGNVSKDFLPQSKGHTDEFEDEILPQPLPEPVAMPRQMPCSQEPDLTSKIELERAQLRNNQDESEQSKITSKPDVVYKEEDFTCISELAGTQDPAEEIPSSPEPGTEEQADFFSSIMTTGIEASCNQEPDLVPYVSVAHGVIEQNIQYGITDEAGHRAMGGIREEDEEDMEQDLEAVIEDHFEISDESEQKQEAACEDESNENKQQLDKSTMEEFGIYDDTNQDEGDNSLNRPAFVYEKEVDLTDEGPQDAFDETAAMTHEDEGICEESTGILVTSEDVEQNIKDPENENKNPLLASNMQEVDHLEETEENSGLEQGDAPLNSAVVAEENEDTEDEDPDQVDDADIRKAEYSSSIGSTEMQLEKEEQDEGCLNRESFGCDFKIERGEAESCISNIPEAFEKDETPTPGDCCIETEMCKPVEATPNETISSHDREDDIRTDDQEDDTDSIDGGTPDDVKQVGDSFATLLESQSESEMNKENFKATDEQLAMSDCQEVIQNPGTSLQSSLDDKDFKGYNPFVGIDQMKSPALPSESPFQSNADADKEKEIETFDPAHNWGEPMGLPSPPPLDESKEETSAGAENHASKSVNSKTGDKTSFVKNGAQKAKDMKTGDTKKSSQHSKTTDKKPSLVTSKTNAKNTDIKSKSPRPLAGAVEKKTTTAPTEKKGPTKGRPISAPTKSVSKTTSKPRAATARRPASAANQASTGLGTKVPTLPPLTPYYVDLTYIPNHGDPVYSDVEFFKRVRARFYVLSALSPNPQILNSLLEAKQTWEDEELAVTVIPTYDNDTLHHWMALHKDQLNQLKIDVAPSANRCTIQLQDHETSCSAYRLEF